ncbi:MAG TPA: sulfite exporter TauE/SafE family protein [Candidatus Saccharimonadales bacterium]|nr:sulfite exporter TauE/SafE family protein [Candidatus Saccharimonadales bacterium]
MVDVGLFLVGIIVGVMNAIAGGGMLVGFPVLLAAGLPALAANVTANIVVLPTQLSSALGYWKYLRKLPRHYLWLLVPCIVGATIGALVLRNTSSTRFNEIVPGLILVAVALFAFQPIIKLHLDRIATTKNISTRPLLYIAVLLLPMSVYGGYFGAGFGFVMLALLSFSNLRDMHQMNGLKNLAAVGIAAASIACLFNTGLIDWHRGLVMAAGGTVGGYGGSRIAQKVSSRGLRITVIVIGTVTTLYLALRTY